MRGVRNRFPSSDDVLLRMKFQSQREVPVTVCKQTEAPD